MNQFIDMVFYVLPAAITGAVAYYFFEGHLKNENNQRQFLLKRQLQKESLPVRLQAYERMVLFLERISPAKLLIRVPPSSDNKEDYEALLIATIEQEFEHNLSQQIYMSDRCWMVINTAKNSTIQLIRKSNMNNKIDSANKLREVMLTNLMEKEAPTAVALAYIKDEVSQMW